MYDLRVGAFVQTLSPPSNAKLFSQFAISRRSPATLAASANCNLSTSGDSYIFEYDGRNCSQVIRSYISKSSSSSSSTKRQQNNKSK